MKRIFGLFLIFAISFSLFAFVLSNPVQAAGATLFLSPGSGSYSLGKSFAIKIMVNSGGGVGINAADSAIKFDPAYITISKINKTNSIFGLWTTEPSYSNSAGTITFSGGSPSSYTGQAGEIFSVTFTTKQVGMAEVNFSSGQVLAADGKGTNIFSGFGHGKYTINEAAAGEVKEKPKVEPKEEIKGILPPLPDVSSPTHPKDDVWYQNNEPEFRWKILADLTGVNYLVSNIPDDIPGAESEGVIENIALEAQPDGELYFHIKYQNRFGFGQTGHKKFLVDVTPPEPFIISVDNGGDSTNPTPKLRFTTIDKTSGLDHYSLVKDFAETIISPDEVSNGYYQLQPLAPGKHQITIAAYDKANNVSSSSVSFIVDPLKAPIITSIPEKINKKEELIIQGTSFYPQVTVKIYIDTDGEDPIEGTVTTDDEGNWSYFHKGELEKGNYEVWAKIIDSRGAQSLDSTRYLLIVVSPSIICAYGWWIVILLLTIIILLVSYIFYQRRQFILEKTRIKKENDEVKSKLSKIFAALREEVDELIELADKKVGLSESERRVKEKLQESLDISEEFISKEVEDVDKEIKLEIKKEIK